MARVWGSGYMSSGSGSGSESEFLKCDGYLNTASFSGYVNISVRDVV